MATEPNALVAAKLREVKSNAGLYTEPWSNRSAPPPPHQKRKEKRKSLQKPADYQTERQQKWGRRLINLHLEKIQVINRNP